MKSKKFVPKRTENWMKSENIVLFLKMKWRKKGVRIQNTLTA